MERSGHAVIVAVIILLLVVIGAGEPLPSDAELTDTLVEQSLVVSGDVSLDQDWEDGEVKEVYGHWSVNEHSENDTVVLDEHTEQLYPDAEGKVSYSKDFQREFSETGNYSYHIEIATTSSEYNVVEGEWEEYNVSTVSSDSHTFTVHEEDLLTIINPRNMHIWMP